MNTNDDYYKTLGVSRNATESEIKKAYRKQALKFHPDRNKEEGAKIKFQMIGEAFEVLMDKNKRREFDSQDGLRDSINMNYYNSFYGDLFDQFFSDPLSPHSASSDEEYIFGSFSNRTRGARKRTRNPGPPPSPPYYSKPQSVKRKLPVSLEELYTGTTKKLKVTRTSNFADKILTIKVIPGCKSGTKVRFPGEGDLLPSGESQDIEFEIEGKPHSRYTRKGDNLYTTVNLSLVEALTGFSKELTRLDGSTLTIGENDPHVITHSGQEKILKGEGMPSYKRGDKGDLIISFQVDFPKSLSIEQRQGIKNLLPF